MKNIFILEDQIKGLELIKSLVISVFGNNTIISHKGRIKAVTDSDLNSCDFAFIDLSLPDGFSFEVITKSKTLNPDTPVIVTTLYAEDEIVFKALRSGADGYLLKSDGKEKLALCLNRILEGEPPISPQIARKLMMQFSADAVTDIPIDNDSEDSNELQLAKLTERETEVLLMISQGLVTKEIVRDLDLSLHTVNGLIKSIYKKLDINSRAQAAAIALNSGLH